MYSGITGKHILGKVWDFDYDLRESKTQNRYHLYLISTLRPDQHNNF